MPQAKSIVGMATIGRISPRRVDRRLHRGRRELAGRYSLARRGVSVARGHRPGQLSQLRAGSSNNRIGEHEKGSTRSALDQGLPTV